MGVGREVFSLLIDMNLIGGLCGYVCMVYLIWD